MKIYEAAGYEIKIGNSSGFFLFSKVGRYLPVFPQFIEIKRDNG
jgi:hypothetical protein